MARQKIGKYEIIEKIGQGGMGAVYKATHPTLNRNVIIKQLTLTRSNVIERFKREARIMLDLRNEHIVQVYDHFKEGKFYYIAMEYVDGTSLDDLIDKKRYLSNEAASIIFFEICKGLKYAHDKGVIHRDIKPANILISKNGEVKIVDFGIATSKSDDEPALTKDGSTLGSPAYMSPEQIYNTKQVDKRADIYSLGVTLYKMLTGKLPYPPNISPETITLISKGKYTLPIKLNPKVSPKLQSIIAKCIKPKKRQRYRDISEIIRILKPLIKKYTKDTGRESENQKIINELIKSYLQGKEIQNVKIKVSFKKRIENFLFRLRSLFIVVVLITFFGFYSLTISGFQHELLNSRTYGSCRIELIATETINKRNYKEIKAFIYDANSGLFLKEVTMKKNDKSFSPEQQSFYSPKFYLKSGLYRVETDFFNSKFEEYILIKPVSEQRNDKMDQGVKFTYNTLPVYNISVSFKFSDDLTNANLDDVDKYILYKNDWIRWEDLLSRDPYYLRSGNKYSFIFKKRGYLDKKLESFVLPYQDTVLINVSLQKAFARVHISSNDKSIKVLINNSQYYYDALNSNKYTRFQPYFITVLFNRLLYHITGREKGAFAKKSLNIFEDREIVLNPDVYKISVKKGSVSDSIELTLRSYESVRIKIKYDKENKKINIIKL